MVFGNEKSGKRKEEMAEGVAEKGKVGQFEERRRRQGGGQDSGIIIDVPPPPSESTPVSDQQLHLSKL